MGLIDKILNLLFGKKKNVPEQPSTPQQQQNSSIISESKIEKKDVFIKVIDLNSETDLPLIINEISDGNIVIADIGKILNSSIKTEYNEYTGENVKLTNDNIYNQPIIRNLSEKLKDSVFEAYGDIRKISEKRYLIIPKGMKFGERSK